MKVLLYTEDQKLISESGLGKAIEHQKIALESQGIEYTLDPSDTYDVAHINYYLLKSVLLAERLKEKNIPIVYHAHSTEEDFRNSFVLSNYVSPAFKKWIVHCYQYGDAIITPTPYSKRLLEGYGLTAPIYAISNGIDTSFFTRSDEQAKVFRETYGFSKEDKVILGIGLYLERKGILDFIELAKRMPEYKFIWMGYTPLYAVPKKIREAVKTQLPNLQFPGYVEQHMIRNALNGCDLYIFPTYEETEGIPIIEACAMKTKSLIRDIGVFEDWLIDGENIYKATTLDEFYDKAKGILNGELPDLTENAFELAKERDIKVIGKQLKAVYESVLKK